MYKKLGIVALLLMPLALVGCSSSNSEKLTSIQTELDSSYKMIQKLERELDIRDTTITELRTNELLSDGLTLDKEDFVITEEAPTVINSSFGNQPTQAGGDYVSNTAQLNTYAHNNMVGVSVPAYASTMTITLKKDVIDNGRNIIMYVESNGRHCGGRILGAELGEVKGRIFTFDLTSMPVYPATCGGDRTSKINGKNIAVGGYVTTYDGNGFSSITFN